MANYYVGPDADYANVQAAIDALYGDVGTASFTEEHNIVITNGAAYDGYRIFGLAPTSTYGLTVTAATASKPIILAKSSGVNTITPVEIGVPNVTIERQEFRGGPYGVMVNSDGDNFVLRGCMVRDPWRVGVLVNGADSIFIYNNVIYAPNTCFVGQDLKKCAIFFNTMKNGMNSLKRESVEIPANVVDPYPAASVLHLEKENNNTDTVYIRDNNLVATNGVVISTNEACADYITSDYNNYFSPNDAVAHFLPLSGYRAMDLKTWRRVTGQDAHSISEDPRFYQGKVNEDLEDGIYQDLRLRAASLLRAKAEDLDVFSGDAYIETGNLTGDFLDVLRTTPQATMGAYELGGSVYNYWDRIFPITGDDPHGDTEGILEVAMAHYASVVQPWYPKIKTGFFWARDNLYYLFSDKSGATLDQIRWYKFSFTGDLIPGSVTAYFESGELADDNWNIRGDEFIFKSAGYSVTGEEQEVSISGEQLIWDTGENQFTTGDYTWNAPISSGERIFVLDPAPVPGTPIIVTDTSIDPDHDTGELPFGYAVSWDDDLEKVVIEFQSGELPENRFSGVQSGDPYVLNDVISFFTWGAFATYGDYIANFPGLQAWGQFTRSFEYEELTEMTIEWETSNTGIREIVDLSMNPIHNSKTEGFICIPSVACRQFDRTLTSGETTLQDDWQPGRTGDPLPWGRVTGKNKWHPLIREFSAPYPRAAAHDYPTGEFYAIDSVPGPLVALQGTTGEEVLFTFMDVDNNPVAFEHVSFELTTTTGEDTGEFPGYIAKRNFGLYTKLGQSLSRVETDSGGHVALRYIPPDNDAIVLFNPTGVTSGDLNWFNTIYDIYPDNHGNPTILNATGELVITSGEVTTGDFTGEASGVYYLYELDEYPVRGSVKAYDDTLRLQEVYHTSVQDGQYYVDYENKTIRARSDGPLTVSYSPLLIWRDPDYPRRLFYSDDLSLPSYFVVSHDAWIRLTSTGGSVSQIHDIVCRNPYDTGDA